MQPQSTLGKRLRELRGDRTLATVAEAAGISPSYLSDLEHGRATPSLDTLELLGRAFGTTAAYLLRGTEYGTSPTMPAPGERWRELEDVLIVALTTVFALNPFVRMAPVEYREDGEPVLTLNLPDGTVRIGVVAQISRRRE